MFALSSFLNFDLTEATLVEFLDKLLLIIFAASFTILTGILSRPVVF